MATENLQIPDIAASQNQKEVTANAAHNLLDRAINGDDTVTITATDTFTTTETRENGFIELIGSAGATTVDMPDTNSRNLTILNSTNGVITIRNSAMGGSNQQVIGIGKTKEFFYDGIDFFDGSGGSTLSTEDDGAEQEADTTVMNFVGGGVVVTNPVTGEVTVTVDGGPDASGFLTRNELFHVRDEKVAGSVGGTATLGSWLTRTLNTTKANDIAGASLSANQIILPAGTYYIWATAPALGVDNHIARLRNITDGTTTIVGTNSRSRATELDTTLSTLAGRFTITAQKTFEVQHRVRTTNTGDGFGSGFDLGEVEVFTDVRIWRDPGVSSKPPVRFATVVDGDDATAFENGDTVDGVTLVTGDRFLRKNQSTGAENGIYVVNASGAPTRASDLDDNEDVGLGVTIPVLEGTLNGRSVWMHTAGTDIGTDTLTFDKIPVNKQIAPPTATNTTTLTDAQMLGGILLGTPTGAETYTTRTGTEIETALGGTIATDDSFDLTVINLGATATDITMAGGTGVTFVGDVFVENPTDKHVSGAAHATFRFRRSASNTFIAYRIG